MDSVPRSIRDKEIRSRGKAGSFLAGGIRNEKETEK
jgi:hypothetical protein